MSRAALAAVLWLSLSVAGCAQAAPSDTLAHPSPHGGSLSPVVSPATSSIVDFRVVGELELVTPPEEVIPGSRVQLAAEIENRGTSAGTYLAQLTIDRSEVVSEQEASLEAGESTRLMFDLVAGPPGSYVIWLDDTDLTLEVLGPADFALSAPVVTPSPAELGEQVSVSVVVTNNGGLAGIHLVELAVDGELVDAQEVTLAGNDQTTVSFSIPAASAGVHSVDVNGQDAELIVWNIERPANGHVFGNKLRGGNGRLEVDNGTERDALIVVTQPGARARSLLAFYVRAGGRSTVQGIKDGTYKLFYALGQRWDKHSRRFTSDVGRHRFTRDFPFTTTSSTYTIWTVSLEQVPGGNASSEDVSESDFPALDDDGDG